MRATVDKSENRVNTCERGRPYTRLVDTFSKRLKAALKDSGLKAADVYRALRVSRATWATWVGERESIPAAETCFRLADTLGCTARWLVTGRGPRERIFEKFTQEQIDLALAWPALAPSEQAQVALTVTNAASRLSPTLASTLRARDAEQIERANRLMEAAQARLQSDLNRSR